jgi:hypothetical protein
MQFRAKQIAPPKEWGTFEDLCHALFKRLWRDPLAQKNGRRGQAQHGVDIFGSPNGHRQIYFGVQCKGKDGNYGNKVKWSEVLTEIAKAEKFSPNLDKWILATTAPSDAKLQEAAREISVERRRKGLFSVDVLGWEEIQALMAGAPDVIAEFYPEHADHLSQVVEVLRSLPSLEARLACLVERIDAKPFEPTSSSALKSERSTIFGTEGLRWVAVFGLVAVHALLIGGLAVFALWPEYFQRLDLSKSLFIGIVTTSPFAAIGAGIIYLGAMDRRPLEPEVRYAITFATCTVAVCQIAALWQMFLSGDRQPRSMVFWGVVGAALCSLPAWAKRHEYEEDERDRREGIRGKKSFFRGKRRGGE